LRETGKSEVGGGVAELQTRAGIEGQVVGEGLARPELLGERRSAVGEELAQVFKFLGGVWFSVCSRDDERLQGVVDEVIASEDSQRRVGRKAFARHEHVELTALELILLAFVRRNYSRDRPIP